jgi:triosephosphate isomerase
MRKKIVAGNWKMNLNADEANALVQQLEAFFISNPIGEHKEIILAPPFIYLQNLANQLIFLKGIQLAAQNCHHESKGAFTGEVAASMLKSIDVAYVIIGHSERRAYFGETENILFQKVHQALSNHLKPIFCIGELEVHRDTNQHKNIIEHQLVETLFKLEPNEFAKCVIAYEPVWAIGTGKTASPEQAQEMHHYIRTLVGQQYGASISEDISILYGGSCNPTNAKSLFSQMDVDGGLIGGAALKFEDFLAIFKALQE